MKRKSSLLVVVMASALLLAACGGKAAEAVEAQPAAAVSDAALVISGAADAAWTVADLQALPVTEAEYTNKDGETTSYSGVSFADLFAAAGVDSYTGVSLVAADDYAAELDQATLDGCAKCIVAIGDDGSLRSVMPDMSSAVQVKDLVEIIVN